MTSRRWFMGALAGALGAVPPVVGAQATGRVYRLGILDSGKASVDPVGPYSIDVLLRDRGYVEGQNLIIVRRYAQGSAERLSGFARELADLRLDALWAVGSSAIRAAKDATTTTPIVLLTNGDLVAAGFVQSLARPGGNITGVLIAPEGSLAGKRLQLLREAVPRGTRVVLLVPDDPGPMLKQQVPETVAAASSVGLGLKVVEVRDGDYAAAFATLAALRAQALLLAAHSSFLRDRRAIIELAARYRLPAIYEWPRQVKDGGLMSYGANDLETYQQVASYIDRIFKGAKPSDMAVWQPSKLHLVINLKTARALGIALPPSLLLRADEVIE